MTLKELENIAIEMYGKKGWRTKLANDLCVSPSTVHRWLSGRVPIPHTTALAVRWLRLQVDSCENTK